MSRSRQLTYNTFYKQPQTESNFMPLIMKTGIPGISS